MTAGRQEPGATSWTTPTHDPQLGETPAGGEHRAGSQDSGGRSLSDIVQSIADDTTTLVRQEMALAKAEMKDELSKAGKGAGMLGGAGLAGYLVLLFLSFTLMFGLNEVMPLWVAALITAVVWGVVGAVLAATGRKELKQSHPELPQTQQTLKEDAQWARAQKS